MERRELKARKAVNADRPFQFLNRVAGPVGDPPFGDLGQSLDPPRIAPAACRDVPVVESHVRRAMQEGPVDARVVHLRHQVLRWKGEVLRPGRQSLLDVILAIYRPLRKAVFSGAEIRVPQSFEAPRPTGIIKPRCVGRSAVVAPPDGLLSGLGHKQLEVLPELGTIVETADIARRRKAVGVSVVDHSLHDMWLPARCQNH